VVEMAKFSLGQTVMTCGVNDKFKTPSEWRELQNFLYRHSNGDWGDLCNLDKKANDNAIAHEGSPELQERVLSEYRSEDGTRVWVITEWDRSVTTILFPSEY
jgi:hypothetical protein